MSNSSNTHSAPPSNHSSDVTAWLEEAKAGGPQAFRRICDYYLNNLVRFANRRMQHQGAIHAYGPEDAVWSGLNSFWQGMSKQRFRDLNNRNDVWQILTMLVKRKIIDRIEYDTRERRGGGNVRTESIFNFIEDGAEVEGSIDSCEDPNPATAPNIGYEILDQIDYYIQLLDAPLQPIATKKISGFSNREIADELQLSERTIDRKMKLIRETLRPVLFDEALDDIAEEEAS